MTAALWKEDLSYIKLPMFSRAHKCVLSLKLKGFVYGFKIKF